MDDIDYVSLAVKVSTTDSLKLKPEDNATGVCDALYVSFNAIMTGPRPDLGLDVLNETRVLERLLPSVVRIVGFGGLQHGHKDLWQHTKQVVRQSPPKRTIRIAALYHDVGKPKVFKKIGNEVTFHGHELMSAKAWKHDSKKNVLFPDADENNTILDLITGLGKVESYTEGWTDSAVRRLYKEYEHVWDDLINLALSDITSANDKRRAKASNNTVRLNERAKTLKEHDDKVASMKLPKGLGHVVAMTLNIEGKKLGDFVRMMQREVEDGRLPVHIDAKEYIEWIRERG